MARHLMGEKRIARLSLDEIAWSEGTKRRPLDQSVALLDAFLTNNDQWIIEGCYSDLVEAALPHCNELRFLNPGVEVCVANCRRRPWEPEKFSTPEAQAEMLDRLVEWVREYELRDDEYGLRRHRKLFDSFRGRKREYNTVEAYADA